MLNLTPILKHDQPTSRIKIGAKKIGSNTEIVKVTHKDSQAYFYVAPVDDSIVDGIGNKVRMHRNVKKVFGGIDRGKDFLVDPDVTKDDVVECSSATIRTSDIDPEELEPFLRENDYLLHWMEEVVHKDDTLSTFEITGMRPAGHTTLRVSSETELTFIMEDNCVSGESTLSLGSTAGVGSDELFDDSDLEMGESDETVETTTDEELASLVDDIVGDLEDDMDTTQQGSDDDA